MERDGVLLVVLVQVQVVRRRPMPGRVPGGQVLDLPQVALVLVMVASRRHHRQ